MFRELTDEEARRHGRRGMAAREPGLDTATARRSGLSEIGSAGSCQTRRDEYELSTKVGRLVLD